MRLCSIPRKTPRGCARCTPRPEFARRGVGRLILELCERAATREGFSRVELAATLAGEPLYRACGYGVMERMIADTPSGLRIPLARMGKTIGEFLPPPCGEVEIS